MDLQAAEPQPHLLRGVGAVHYCVFDCLGLFMSLILSFRIIFLGIIVFEGPEKEEMRALWATHCCGDQFMPKMWISTLGAEHNSTALMAAPRHVPRHSLTVMAPES